MMNFKPGLFFSCLVVEVTWQARRLWFMERKWNVQEAKSLPLLYQSISTEWSRFTLTEILEIIIVQLQCI